MTSEKDSGFEKDSGIAELVKLRAEILAAVGKIPPHSVQELVGALGISPQNILDLVTSIVIPNDGMRVVVSVGQEFDAHQAGDRWRVTSFRSTGSGDPHVNCIFVGTNPVTLQQNPGLSQDSEGAVAFFGGSVASFIGRALQKSDITSHDSV